MADQAYFDCVFEDPPGKCCLLDSESLGEVAYRRGDPGWLAGRGESSLFQVPFSRLAIPDYDKRKNKDVMTGLRKRLVLYACTVTLFPPRFYSRNLEDVIARHTFMHRFIRHVSPLPESIVKSQTELYAAALGALTSPDDADWTAFFGTWLRDKTTSSELLLRGNDILTLRLPQQLELIYSPESPEKMDSFVWEAALYHFVSQGDVLKDHMWTRNGRMVTTAMDCYWWADMANLFREMSKHPDNGRFPEAVTTPEGEVLDPSPARFKARWPVNGCLQLEYDGVRRYIDMCHVWDLMGMNKPHKGVPMLAEQGISRSDYTEWPDDVKEGDQGESAE